MIKTILINDRYLIYTDTYCVYDTKNANDIPQYIFKMIEKLKTKKEKKLI